METPGSGVIHLNSVTDMTKISVDKHRYINTKFKKVSAKMYDYNCDVKLKVGSKILKAHRHVLSDASDYFDAMFCHDMQEKEKDAIEIHEVSPDGFAVMMEYFYHGHVTLEDNIIADVLEAARFFQVQWLVDACSLFLIRHTSIENFDTVLELADQFALGDLHYDIYKFIGQNFVELAKQKRFESMSLELFSQLLNDDYYIEASESVILQTAVEWLNYDWEERMPYFEELMKQVRFPLLSPEELQDLPEVILENKEIQPLVQYAIEYWENPFKQCLDTSKQTQLRGAHEVAVLISAVDDAEMIEYKDPKRETPGFVYEEFDTGFLDNVMEYSSVTTLGNFLFVIGGYNRSFFSASKSFRYDPRFKLWLEIAPMLYPRSSFALCASDSKLFAIGGVNHDENDQEHILRSSEMYDPESNTWMELSELPCGLFDLAAVSTHDKVIFISGGITELPENPIPVNFVYEYVQELSRWLVCKPMIVARQGHSMISTNENIFVFGGYTSGVSQEGEIGPGYGFTDCFVNEMYDLSTQQWSVMTSTPEDFGHIQRSVTLVDNSVYIIGGQYISRFLHKFNTETLEFSESEFCGPHYLKMATLSIALPYEVPEDEPVLPKP